MIELERLLHHLLNQFLVYTQNAPLLFNSGIFLVLFLIFYGGYIILYKNDLLRIVYVIAFSFFFYYKSSGGFVFLLGFSALFNYLSGFLIDSFQLKRNRKIILWISILVNVGLLFYFKYTFSITIFIYNFLNILWYNSLLKASSYRVIHSFKVLR